jgi:bifunctional non-homologous end joining protein LigD
VYEIKADGYRAQLHLADGEVKVYSRAGHDWSEQFSSIAVSADHHLKANSAIIDGEAVVYGAGGVPDFQQLRRELGPRRSQRVRYHAFDLLYLDGYDLRGAAYEDRKHLLRRLLKNAPETFIYVEALAADGKEIFDKGCKMGLEGLVANDLVNPTAPGARRAGSSSSARRAKPFPSSHSSKNWGLIPARSPRSTSAGVRKADCCTQVRSAAAIRKRPGANCASGSIR